jgi:hypothetical protein
MLAPLTKNVVGTTCTIIVNHYQKTSKKRQKYTTCLSILVYWELSTARNCVNHGKPLIIVKWGLNRWLLFQWASTIKI